MNSVNDQAMLSYHARARMASLRIAESEVRSTLREPIATYPGGPHHPPGRLNVLGRFIVVVAPGSDLIITIKLWSSVPYSHGVHHRYNFPPFAGPSAA